MSADIPPRGTRDYDMWELGARAEADARREVCTEAGLRVLEVVESLAEIPNLTEAEIAAFAFEIYAPELPFWRRIRLAWRMVRHSAIEIKEPA